MTRERHALLWNERKNARNGALCFSRKQKLSFSKHHRRQVGSSFVRLHMEDAHVSPKVILFVLFSYGAEEEEDCCYAATVVLK